MPRGVNRYDEARIQGRLWTPKQEGNTFLWLDAMNTGNFTVDGSNGVSQWNDVSGNSRHFTQSSSSNRVIYQPFGYNGLPAVDYNGTDLYLYCDTSLTGTTVYVYIMCWIGSSIPNDGRWIGASATGVADYDNASYFNIFYSPGNGVKTWRNNVGSGALAFTTDAPAIVGGNFDGTNEWASLNGKDSSSSGSTGSFNVSRIYLGRYPAASGYGFQRYINEVIFETGAYNPARKQKIEGYLAWKWLGSNNTLVASHPFKMRPPLIGD